MTTAVTKINIFDKTSCIKCRNRKCGQEEQYVVSRRLDKLMQYIDFTQDERLRLYLSESEKNSVVVKIHLPHQKTISREMKRKGDIVSKHLKNFVV